MAAIRCSGVRYRQGFIEVVGGIHAGHVNLEVWEVDPNVDITEKMIGDPEIPDDAFKANTEIELDLAQAKMLVSQLQAAIDKLEAQ